MREKKTFEPNGIRGRNMEVFWDGGAHFTLKSGRKEITVPLPENRLPPRGGLLLAHNVGDVAGKRVCEIGTESHGVNMFAALLGGARSVYGIEKGEQSAEFLSNSFAQLGLSDKAEVHAGSRVPENASTFDVILANLPQMPSNNTEDTGDDFYNYAGETGWEIIDSYLQQSQNHLSEDGYVRILLLDFLGIEERTGPDIPSAFERLEALGLTPKVIARSSDVAHAEHPFVTREGLFEHVTRLYPNYPFMNGGYGMSVVEGRRI